MRVHTAYDEYTASYYVLAHTDVTQAYETSHTNTYTDASIVPDTPRAYADAQHTIIKTEIRHGAQQSNQDNNDKR